MSSFISKTLLIRIQYCYQLKYFTDLILHTKRTWNYKQRITNMAALPVCNTHKYKQVKTKVYTQ